MPKPSKVRPLVALTAVDPESVPDAPDSGVDGARITRARSRQVSLIGRRIRELRRNKLTLTQLAGVSQVSVGLLSRLENGVGNPSFATLNAIARALDVDVYSFFESPDAAPTVLQPADRTTVRNVRTKVEVEWLVPDPHGRLVVTIIVLPPKFQGSGWAKDSDGQQFEFVLEGAVTIYVDHEVHELNEGDSILFDGSRPIMRRNPSRTQRARIFRVSGEPALI